MGRLLREAGVARDADSADVLATALWSGAHGICVLAVTGKLQVATHASVQRLLDVLLDRFLEIPDAGAQPARTRRRKK